MLRSCVIAQRFSIVKESYRFWSLTLWKNWSCSLFLIVTALAVSGALLIVMISLWGDDYKTPPPGAVMNPPPALYIGIAGKRVGFAERAGN